MNDPPVTAKVATIRDGNDPDLVHGLWIEEERAFLVHGVSPKFWRPDAEALTAQIDGAEWFVESQTPSPNYAIQIPWAERLTDP